MVKQMGLKQSEKSELTRERILAAAEEEFSEKGFYGARIDSIAAASGMNKRMIYAHFDSKENLYTKVLLRVYEKLAQCERQFMVDNLAPLESIKNIIEISFEYLKNNPNFVRMLMWENLNKGMSIPEGELARLKAPSIEYIKKQLVKGMELGIFRSDVDVYHVSVSLMNFCFSHFSNQHTMTSILGRDITSEEEVRSRAEFINDIITKYLV